MKILICDDNRHLNNILAYGLTLAGSSTFEITTTHNGQEAVNAVIRQEPDIVIMDIMMPVLDGIVATKRIREFSNIPIVALSAYSDSKTKTAMLTAGANKFLVKPVDYQELAVLLKRLVSKKPSSGTKVTVDKQRRLNMLKEQQAIMGVATPPHILIEIEDLESELNGQP